MATENGQDLKLFSKSFLAIPGECNAQQEISIWHLFDKIVEVATLHANSWGVGYQKLIVDNQAWVLSRVGLEMARYPKVNETYTLSTWIEDYNRHFSERNMEITDCDGNTIGYARTIWAVIDLATRESRDISTLEYIRDNKLDKPCPISPLSKIRNVEHARESRYTFLYADTDSNRHVNSVRYIHLLLNQWPLEFHDRNRIARFEIYYLKEGHAGEETTTGIDDTTHDCKLEICHQGECLVKARIVFKQRETK